MQCSVSPEGMLLEVRHTRRHEIDTRLFKAKQEMSIATQSVDLGDDQFGTVEPAGLRAFANTGRSVRAIAPILLPLSGAQRTWPDLPPVRASRE